MKKKKFRFFWPDKVDDPLKHYNFFYLFEFFTWNFRKTFLKNILCKNINIVNIPTWSRKRSLRAAVWSNTTEWRRKITVRPLLINNPPSDDAQRKIVERRRLGVEIQGRNNIIKIKKLSFLLFWVYYLS